MSAGSVARRSWGSFIGGRPHVPRAGGRARDGYTVRQRFWASFTGLDLPWARVGSVSAPEAPVRPPAPSARPAASSDAIAGRLEPGWFALPPILTVAGLTAAGGDAVILETSSPDGGARFLLRTQGVEAGPSTGWSWSCGASTPPGRWCPRSGTQRRAAVRKCCSCRWYGVGSDLPPHWSASPVSPPTRRREGGRPVLPLR